MRVFYFSLSQTHANAHGLKSKVGSNNISVAIYTCLLFFLRFPSRPFDFPRYATRLAMTTCWTRVHDYRQWLAFGIMARNTRKNKCEKMYEKTNVNAGIF